LKDASAEAEDSASGDSSTCARLQSTRLAIDDVDPSVPRRSSSGVSMIRVMISPWLVERLARRWLLLLPLERATAAAFLGLSGVSGTTSALCEDDDDVGTRMEAAPDGCWCRIAKQFDVGQLGQEQPQRKEMICQN